MRSACATLISISAVNFISAETFNRTAMHEPCITMRGLFALIKQIGCPTKHLAVIEACQLPAFSTFQDEGRQSKPFHCDIIIFIPVGLFSKKGFATISQGPVYSKRLHRVMYKLGTTNITFLKKKLKAKSQSQNLYRQSLTIDRTCDEVAPGFMSRVTRNLLALRDVAWKAKNEIRVHVS